NALPTGTEKTSLTNRLNVVQKAIDDGQALANQIATATASVLKAESSMMQVDVTSALTLVNALPTSTEKTNLTARLYTVQEAIDLAKQIATATTSVIKAEGTKQQVDVDDSRSLVNALSASTEKTNLTNRLNTVQTEIDASNGVYTDMMTELANMKDYLLTGEGTKEDVLAMRDALNSIFDDSTTLLNGAHRANVAQYVQDVLDIIELLETIWEKIESGELAGVTDLVEQLPESDLKNDTEENLSDAIAYEYQLEEATKAVELAESTKQQVNVNNARLLVNELAKETDRNRLSSRIDVTQSEIDLANLTVATSSVVKAEKSKLQADLTAARTLVSALKSSKEKNSLITRLDTVQKAIDDAKALAEQIATATASVVKAEGSKLQVDVTVARSLVSALPTGIEKTNLTTRLDTAQKAIDDAKALSEQIATATASVVKAEGSKLQADVTAARTLVNALPTGAEKTNLTTRLDTVQGAITLADKIATATTSVVKAEGSKLQADLDASLLLVNSLPTGTEKTNLTNRLNVVQKAIDDAKALATQIAVATTAVLKAEGSKLQADVNSAKTLVNALPTGTDKTNLTNRLDTVQAEITLAEKIVTATASVTKAEDSKTQADVNASRSLVNNLPDGTEKTNLNNRLDVVQKAIEDAKALAERIALATAAVIKAEETKLDVDIQTARHFTEALPNSQVKTELLDRIAVVEKANNEEVLLKNAKEAVDNLDDNSTKAEVDSAKELVSLLPDSIEKNKLIDRITNIELVQKAISSVEQAERMQTNYNISLAEKAILLLPDGLKKTELAERITELKLTLEAESKVVSAETTKREPYLTEAYVSVNKLKDGLKKTQLMGRLQAVKDAIEIEAEKALLTEATSLVVLAELHQREPYLTDAKEKVSKLKDGPDKTALEARIQSVEDAIATGPEAPVVDPALLKAAEQQVTFAERYKRDPYFTRAQEAINKLPNSKERTELQARLDAVMN
ncbi:GA-like domain-containing protein, partial [Psychrobacillus sp. FSL H8-0510]|uniref:GA-like domain-containing protein n=1 Tax=Psychrobacillus sp. FSL H8-0510 TaxID=2921394 RepID=UPI0030FD3270